MARDNVSEDQMSNQLSDHTYILLIHTTRHSAGFSLVLSLINLPIPLAPVSAWVVYTELLSWAAVLHSSSDFLLLYLDTGSPEYGY